jgi:FkbM family methyltransferase
MHSENINGLKMNILDSDHPIVDSLRETGVWEPKTTQFIKDNLKPGQTFVDVGASVGYYTLLASELVGSQGKVYAFEPAKETFEMLEDNIRMNNLGNVKSFNLALSDKKEVGKLYVGKSPGQNSLSGKGSYEEVEEITLDEIAKSEEIVPDVIKIDVEGAELYALKGMMELLESNRDLVIIIEDYTQDAVEQLTKDFGFRIITTEREAGNYILARGRKDLKAMPEPMTFHLLGTFQTPTNKKEGVGYAFCAKIMHLAKMLKYLGHKVIFYGAEGSEVECDEFVQVLSRGELPVELKNNIYIEDSNHQANLRFNERAIAEINRRTPKYFHSRDILLIPTGSHQRPVANNVKIPLQVEIGVGYKGIFSNKRIFESYSWMHWQYGKLGKDKGNPCDAVIPPMFDPNDFDYSEKKDDYFLFIGRIITNKGVMIAKDACEAIGAKLKVAGIDNGLEIEGKNVEMVGFADANKRRELISKAKAVFVPTLYLEPFGYVIIEAAFSGTPVITTDFGAFVENVQQGKTGYRCRTFVDFIEAAKNIDKINPKDCRDWAMGYTLEKVAPMYQDYFEQLQNLFGRGWYSRL